MFFERRSPRVQVHDPERVAERDEEVGLSAAPIWAETARQISGRLNRYILGNGNSTQMLFLLLM